MKASRLERVWDQSLRDEHFRADEELRAANATAAAEGAPLTHFWRRQYVPEEGMFRDAPVDLRLGSRLPDPDRPEAGVKVQGKGFRKDGVAYAPGDCLFLGPEVFDAVEGARSAVQLPEYLSNSRFHKVRGCRCLCGRGCLVDGLRRGTEQEAHAPEGRHFPGKGGEEGFVGRSH